MMPKRISLIRNIFHYPVTDCTELVKHARRNLTLERLRVERCLRGVASTDQHGSDARLVQQPANRKMDQVDPGLLRHPFELLDVFENARPDILPEQKNIVTLIAGRQLELAGETSCQDAVRN